MDSRERKRRGRGAENNIPWVDIARGVGNVAKGAWNDSNTLQRVGMLQVPVVSDIAGLAGDIQMHMEDPETRGLGNYALTAAGLLPFVPAGLGTIGGKMAARNLEDVIQDPKWFDRPAGGQGFEFSDADMEFNQDELERVLKLLDARRAQTGKNMYYEARLSDLVDHPMYFKAYPEAADTPVRIAPDFGKKIGVPDAIGGYGNGAIYLSGQGDDIAPTLLHEMQHMAQEAEGTLSTGGNTKQIRDILTEVSDDSRHKFLEKALGAEEAAPYYGNLDADDLQHLSNMIYRRLPGEYEARMTAQSMDMTQDMLEAFPFNERVPMAGSRGTQFPSVRLKNLLGAKLANKIENL